MKRKYTIVAPLNLKDNKDIIEYFGKFVSVFSQMERKLYYIFRNDFKIDINNLNKQLQSDYNITKRYANSAIKDIKGRVKALKELKKYEVKQKKWKIQALEFEIAKLTKDIDKFKDKIAKNEKINLKIYRNVKRKLVSRKLKLDRYKSRLISLEWRLENNRLKLCFGTKKLLKQNITEFKLQRDSQLFYVGCKSETSCNQNLQLTYVNKINQFIIKLRKADNNIDNKDKYVYGKCYFNFNKNKLIDILNNKTSPLTYSIIRKNGCYYLHCIFEISYEKEQILTRKDYGCIGVDVNKGFLAVSETNEFGSLVNTYILKYRYGKADKRDNDFKEIGNILTKRALETGKDIVIEILDFTKTKAKVAKGQNKEYNNMLHSLAYSSFSEIIDNMTFKNRVGLIKVNPAYTGKIGSQKYAKQMKLNIHNSAAYVIARKGQGFEDKLVN